MPDLSGSFPVAPVAVATPSASVHYLQSLLRVMADQGLDGHALFAQAGVDTALFDHPDKRVPFELLLKAWHLAMAEAGDPTLGLFGMEHFHPAIYGPLASIILTSPTLGDVATQLLRFQAIPEDATHAQMQLQGDEVVLRIASAYFADEPIRPVIEYALSELIGMARFLTDRQYHDDIYFLSVCFRHRPAVPVVHYAERLGVAPRFEQDCNEVRFSARLLALPTACPDPELFQGLLERMTARYAVQEDSLVQQVEHFLIAALPRGVPRIGELAAHLNITVRTLQRRLRQAGWGYAELLDDMRYRLAQQLLGRDEVSITEAAFLLGFSEASAFHKAFHRWAGVSPGEWRRRRMQHQSVTALTK